jgi:hypothetical protein
MSFTHPRRTTKTTSAALTLSESNASGRSTSNTNMSLRKGATFHHPTTPDRELPNRPKVPSLPRRSQSTLEDVVDAHKRRVALTLGDIDRSLSSLQDSSPTVRQAFRDEADPVSRSILDHTVGPSIMERLLSKDPHPMGKRVLRPRTQQRRPARYADSGLGSSISSSGKDVETQPTSVSDNSCPAASAITRSAATHFSTLESLPRLSPRATNRIHEHILKPLLAKSSLKDFHPIVRDCPRRIHQKEIVCLRDLEKTLMFMAPVSEIPDDDVARGVAHWFSRLKERTKSAELYLDFCLTSIRCIQATVEYLNEREQTRPSDRPYSNGYFVDLVDQIKQYAQQVQAAKEKEENGETPGEMDAELYVTFIPDCRVVLPSMTHDLHCFATLTNCARSDEVRLYGGLNKNGRPAELVRVKKNGKAISIATGQPVDLDEDTKIQFKRSLSEEAEDDESILRSMARRKRSASASELAPKRCREPGCDKEFKRPCDLTKHEKTHSRPWKCPVESCKYHEYGWPTEKEMDRHHNDKHSSAPPMYKCHFDCPYQSKRESNCKQHMEKAHGWQYVRSKNNGKNREKGSGSTTGLPTPQTTNMQTPSSDGNVVHTPDENMFDDIDHVVYDGPAVYNHAEQLNFPEYNTHSDIDVFGTNHAHLQLEYSPISEMNQTSSSASPFLDNMGQDHFQENFHDFENNGTGDFSLYDNEDLYSANVQLPTPTHEVFQNLQNGPYEPSGVSYCAEPVPHISPVGQGNSMLYTPNSLPDMDDFDAFFPNNSMGNTADFELFPPSNSGTISSSANSGFFGELAQPVFHPGTSGKELLAFYNKVSTAAANGAYPMNNGATTIQTNYEAMDWMDEGFSN